MKDIKLSFPYPSTSRHNLSQDVSTSMSMGLVTPIRIVKVLPGDSHRIATSFSLVSNPLVKPLLQGVRLRYCRFWVPSRIYNIDQRANNSNFDPLNQTVRVGVLGQPNFPAVYNETDKIRYYSNFQQSSLFDYLGLANYESSFSFHGNPKGTSTPVTGDALKFYFNAEPYLGYIDICRNYFSDSATGLIAWSSLSSQGSNSLAMVVAPLGYLDSYIDNVQNSRGEIRPYDYANTTSGFLQPFILDNGRFGGVDLFHINASAFFESDFGYHHLGLCVPPLRPDRLSRLFDTKPLTSQNASISPSEITIGNLSFLAKLQRYLTRRFFGGSRFTDVMYSVFGQHVPHVDSPVLLDVFDQEIGSELVASTNADTQQNPGVLGGYFSSSGVLSTVRGRSRKRYTFNENGYIIDVAYIMPRLNRCSFLDDFYPVSKLSDTSIDGTELFAMSQGNFVPDFNGIGWQQPAFVSNFLQISLSDSDVYYSGNPTAFCCEPSWQQYRTLPDVCHGALNPIRGQIDIANNFAPVNSSTSLNAPLFTFNDRPNGYSYYSTTRYNSEQFPYYLLASQMFVSPADLNRVFGVSTLTSDNIFVVFRYSHQAKRQVTKRFTLTFN